MINRVLISLLAFLLIACGADEHSDFWGTWKLKTSSDKDFTFSFHDDGTFIAIEDGSVDSKGVYEISGDVLTLYLEYEIQATTDGINYKTETVKETQTITFSIAGNVMILEHHKYNAAAIYERV